MTNVTPNLKSLQVRSRTPVSEQTTLLEGNGLLFSESSKIGKTTNSKEEIEFARFLSEVKRAPSHLMTPEQLAWLAISLTRSESFRDLINENVLYKPDRPGTEELHFDKSCSILVVSLLPGQRVPSHDHGHSFEIGIVMEGTLSVIDYKQSEYQELVPELETEVGKGGIFATERYQHHYILNRSQAKTLSVHIHSPGWRISK